MSGRALGSMTSPDVEARRGELILVVPLGACEQHGPHLPLWTDSLLAESLCGSLAEHRDDVVVSPLVGVAASGEHAGFAGTLSVGSVVLAAYCTELVRSARAWARGVVVVSGHGGNLDALRTVERTGREEGDAVVVFLARIQGSDAHAGRTETSLVLALADAQVRHNEMVIGTTASLASLEGTLRAQGVAAVSPSGVLGDPTVASAAEGRTLYAGLVSDLLEDVDATFGEAR